MKVFKLWTGGNVHLNTAVRAHAIELGYTVAPSALRNPDIASYEFSGGAVRAMTENSMFFASSELRPYILLEYFAMPLDKTYEIYHPITGKKIAVSEESYKAIKDAH
jgi:hypothetical protein